MIDIDEQDRQDLSGVLSEVLILVQKGEITLESVNQYQLQELTELFE